MGHVTWKLEGGWRPVAQMEVGGYGGEAPTGSLELVLRQRVGGD